jgi:hypothetical protein
VDPTDLSLAMSSFASVWSVGRAVRLEQRRDVIIFDVISCAAAVHCCSLAREGLVTLALDAADRCDRRGVAPIFS